MIDLRSFVIGIVLMLRKFTLIDITIYVDTVEDDYKNGIMILPIVGLAIGFFACLISSLKLFYDGLFVSTLILTYYSIITKTVNLKDTYRTLNYIIKPKNQSEQISGIIGVVIICLFYFSVFSLVNSATLFLMPVAGFSGLIILSAFFDRNKEGTTILKHCTKYHRIFAFIISFALAAILNYKLVIPLTLTYMISAYVISLIDEKIKLLPNSIEGFIIEIIQIIFLFITYLFKII